MSDSNLILSLINRYVATTLRLATQLRTELGVVDLLSAVHSRRVPPQGKLENGTSYRFHGTGCAIQEANLDVDFDFGPDGRADGFDAWRLRQFTEQFSSYPGFHELEAVESALLEAEREGLISKPGWPPSAHLYYLSDRL